MAFIQGGFNAGQNPFVNQFPAQLGAPSFGGPQSFGGFQPQQAQMMFMLQALMQAKPSSISAHWHWLPKNLPTHITTKDLNFSSHFLIKKQCHRPGLMRPTRRSR